MTKTFALAAAAIMASASFAQTSIIKSVTTTKTDGGGYKITVTGDHLSTPKSIWALRGSVFIAEFASKLGTDKGKVKPDFDGIKTVEYGWYTSHPAKVRVAVRFTDDKIKPVIAEIENGYTITFGGDIAAKTSVPATPAILTSTANQPEGKVVNGVFVPTLPYPTETHPVVRSGSAAVKKTAETLSTMVTETLAAQSTKPNLKDPILEVTSTTNLTAPKTTVPGISPLKVGPNVSLDFVSTDIIQILKALSIQSSVNIVSAPDVSPSDKPLKLTVSLANVSLDEALSYVTAISSLRYAKVGNTYIVTPRDTFAQAMNSVMERMGQQSQTLVVNLVSGEAEKIKEATLKAMPQDGRNGYYDIIVPTPGSIAGVPQTTPGADAKDGGAAATQPTAPAGTPKHVYYLMLVGDKDRIAAVDSYIRDLDKKIATSTSLGNQMNKGTAVIPIQSGETGRIKEMIDRLIAEHPRASEFSVTESVLEGTTKGEAQTMALLLFGPKDDLNRIEDWAKAMDKDICSIIGKPYESSNAGLEKIWDVVDLNYVEPTTLKLDLVSRFKGLQVSLMPDPVSPGMTGKTSSTESNSGAAGAGGGDQASSPQSDGGQSSSASTKTEEHTITGQEPMRIVLRGTQAMINEAKSYISMVDRAPRQVALELRVMEMTKEDALRIGIDWSALTGGQARTWRFNQGLGDTAASPGTLSGGTDNSLSSGDSVDFLATLDQMNNGRNLIARPNALVSDGRSTTLFVGDTVRYIKSIQSTQNGTTVETGEVNVGVSFNTGVRIGANGNVAMNLDQNFSILNGFTSVPGGGNLPQTSDRHTSMFVNMKDGETLAIGGLIQDQDRKSHSGIPILKDLPFIGYLFGRTDNKRTRTEIVFFLTAHVVDESNRADAAAPGKAAQETPNPLEDYMRKYAPKNGMKDDSKGKGK